MERFFAQCQVVCNCRAILLCEKFSAFLNEISPSNLVTVTINIKCYFVNNVTLRGMRKRNEEKSVIRKSISVYT